MAGFNPYNTNFYIQDLQNMKDRIDRTMQQYQQNQFAQPQQAPITQNFQIAPNQPQTELQSAYVNNIEEVKNTFVIKKGLFITKDLKTLYVKDVNGDIKTFKLEEIVELDEKDKALLAKDKEIKSLQAQLDELKGVIMYASQQPNANNDEGIAAKKSTRVSKSKSDDSE